MHSTPLPSQLQCLARRLVARTLRQWPAARRLRDDLEQEAVLAGLTALRSWDASRATWSTWVWWSMRTAVRRFLLGNVGPVTQPFSARRRRAPRALGAPVPATLVTSTPAPDSRALALLAVTALLREATRELRRAHRCSPKSLSLDAFVRRDVAVFVRVACGESVADIATSADLSRQAVYDCLSRMRFAGALLPAAH